MKPYVMAHMLTSLNGKIAGEFGNAPIFATLFQYYDEIYQSLNADAWLAGRVTMQSCTDGDVVLPSEYDDFSGDFIANHNATHFAISADPFGKVLWKDNVLPYGNRPKGHIISLVSEQADKAYLAHLRKIGVSYLIVGEKELDLTLALEKLAQYFNIQRLVLAGGGLINGAFAYQGLLDEIHLIVAPVLELSPQNTAFENKNLNFNLDFAEFKLKENRILADNKTLYLAYQK
ncbi:dihydrofolate reductase family protein [Moraxella nasicaprae]|uniref:Dihydrofolate reductase family protein n=1 Tax=Moraxella nasicaprae TaxID=2904122 RepID=A0ABY6F341_9GAMM|nr:dihydrofolate reductase family protein [Moraxella nasicaprae]UXZ04412.1 dihydrofolate reductase family protein [Moraxella nasicaprae]